VQRVLTPDNNLHGTQRMERDVEKPPSLRGAKESSSGLSWGLGVDGGGVFEGDYRTSARATQRTRDKQEPSSWFSGSCTQGSVRYHLQDSEINLTLKRKRERKLTRWLVVLQ
jgi:hypothetical protein